MSASTIASIFGYRGAARPPLLFETFSPAESHVFVALYQEGPYLLDPFHHAAVERKEGFWRMRELAPGPLLYQRIFSLLLQPDQAGRGGRLLRAAAGQGRAGAVADAAARFRPVRNRRCQAAARHGAGGDQLCQAALAGSSGRRTGDAQPGRDDRLPVNEFDRAHIWESLSLTPREKHVVDLVLQGHSTELIARAMRIVPGTVKVHRRNIYRKLEIKSQAGLFARFVEIIDAQI